MVLKLVNDREIWDSFVDASPYGLLFHKWDYLTITAQHTGYRLLPYGVYKGEELVCLAPLYFKSTHGVKMLFSPPPMQAVIPYQGLVLAKEFDALKLGKKEVVMDLVATDLSAEIDAISPHYFSLVLVPGFTDVRQFLWRGYAPKVHYTYTIDLSRSTEGIWGDFHYKLRNKIRRAEKAGMDLVRSTDISILYTSLAERFSQPDMNIPMVSKRYFEDLFRAYPDHLATYYLYDHEGTLTGAVATQEYRRFLLWMGTPRIEGISANEYLQWLLVQRARARGYQIFENIGANTPELNFFKAKFCSDLGMYMEVCQKDMVGTLAEWAYSSVINKPWLKRRVISHID
ncbi:GNAT family N-acetyltransferase [Methanoculleus sp.]|uniref:GNAT family N-acetyltransferase n=1 Tax=Methanoculleus sp. TaxID=90427 RepID=UPI0025E5587A|nr:GNAT family N-acetyltransferase [Methanoculleus sp.]MCK9316762.1 GNAT family N-acetyltransferase [Methanoculleus sp.]MDD2252777.1 GNAT family N-acetyltransferase [Methanoculleus sp.]MDD2788673.1 GNAT family N-acetyltransferase [Methanoculleus sp.]MDD3215240.1 GNAT family N-acetyltransferase [Methanoculleus sp.]MDD4313020.1 GNAT family N-acetyltransferase [Methanoculleus sp.]